MRFPSIREVASELRAINDYVENECDVRLQVYPNGSWAVRFGSADYDLDHTGYWGASCVPGNGKRFASYVIAADLLAQAREQHAER